MGIAGGLAALQDSTGGVQIQLPNLHGDIVATVDDDSSAVSTNAYFEQTEYGVPRTGNPQNPSRYGWLGTSQRSADTISGVILMGVRIYNPGAGRFESVDPIPSGNENSFNYPNNPIGQVDTSGQSKHSYNGHHDHWYGVYEIDLSAYRANLIAQHSNLMAGAGAICAAAGASTAGAALVACGWISATLWTVSAWIGATQSRYSGTRGVKIFVPKLPWPSIWIQSE